MIAVPDFDARIDKAQEISLNILLGLFTVIIMAVSLAFGIAGAALIIGFTGLKLMMRYATQFLESLQKESEGCAAEEPIILGSAYRSRTVYRRPVRRPSKTFIRQYGLYQPFVG